MLDGAIDELIDDHEAAWCQFLPQRGDQVKRQQVCAAAPFQCIDIGATVDFVRRDPIAAAVAGQRAKLDGVKPAM